MEYCIRKATDLEIALLFLHLLPELIETAGTTSWLHAGDMTCQHPWAVIQRLVPKLVGNGNASPIEC